MKANKHRYLEQRLFFPQSILSAFKLQTNLYNEQVQEEFDYPVRELLFLFQVSIMKKEGNYISTVIPDEPKE